MKLKKCKPRGRSGGSEQGQIGTDGAYEHPFTYCWSERQAQEAQWSRLARHGRGSSEGGDLHKERYNCAGFPMGEQGTPAPRQHIQRLGPSQTAGPGQSSPMLQQKSHRFTWTVSTAYAIMGSMGLDFLWSNFTSSGTLA